MTVRRETASPNLDAVTLNVRSVHQLLLFRCDSVSFSVLAASVSLTRKELRND